jgi:NhaP-type Na+/H+ or K+/H+ antiporter
MSADGCGAMLWLQMSMIQYHATFRWFDWRATMRYARSFWHWVDWFSAAFSIGLLASYINFVVKVRAHTCNTPGTLHDILAALSDFLSRLFVAGLVSAVTNSFDRTWQRPALFAA